MQMGLEEVSTALAMPLALLCLQKQTGMLTHQVWGHRWKETRLTKGSCPPWAAFSRTRQSNLTNQLMSPTLHLWVGRLNVCQLRLNHLWLMLSTTLAPIQRCTFGLKVRASLRLKLTDLRVIGLCLTVMRSIATALRTTSHIVSCIRFQVLSSSRWSQRTVQTLIKSCIQ